MTRSTTASMGSSSSPQLLASMPSSHLCKIAGSHLLRPRDVIYDVREVLVDLYDATLVDLSAISALESVASRYARLGKAVHFHGITLKMLKFIKTLDKSMPHLYRYRKMSAALNKGSPFS